MLMPTLEKTISGLGYELLEADRDSRGVVRVTIDGPGGIGSDDCSKVGRHLSYYLPVEGVDYARIEVSSPGADRLLVKPRHFERFVGSKAKVSLRAPLDGRSSFVGVIRGVAGDDVTLDQQDGSGELTVGIDGIKSARIVPEFGRRAKANRQGAGK